MEYADLTPSPPSSTEYRDHAKPLKEGVTIPTVHKKFDTPLGSNPHPQ